jgi:hypothetical protein
MSFFFIISCVFSSTKSEKRAEQVLPGSEVVERWNRWGAGGRDGQTMYAHMNK